MANSTIEWKPIPGFEDYEISSDGRIRRIFYMAVSEKSGFLRSSLRDKDGKRHDVMIHTLVAKAFLPSPAQKVYRVRHKDKNRKNNTPSNLYFVTAKIRKLVQRSYCKRQLEKPKVPDYSEHNV